MTGIFQFKKEIENLLQQEYKARLSEAIKRGIAYKKARRSNGTKNI